MSVAPSDVHVPAHMQREGGVWEINWACMMFHRGQGACVQRGNLHCLLPMCVLSREASEKGTGCVMARRLFRVERW